MKPNKSAFIESSLRPLVKGSNYDDLDMDIAKDLQKPEITILENFNVYNKSQRKEYIIRLLQDQNNLPNSTQKLITIVKQFFPKI